MKTTNAVMRIGVCLIVLSIVLFQSSFAQTVNKLENVNYIERGSNQTIKSAMFSSEAHFRLGNAATIFNTFLPTSADDELRFEQEVKPDASITVHRFGQYHKGIRVEHGTYTLTARNEEVRFMTGNYYKAAGLATNPVLTESIALNKVLTRIGAEKYAWEAAGMEARIKRQKQDSNATYLPKGKLVYIEDFLSSDEPDGKLHLAWRFDVYALQPVSRKVYYIDASTGKMLFEDAIIKHVVSTGNSLYSGNLSFETVLLGTNYLLHDLTRGNSIRTFTLNNTTSVDAEITNSSTTWSSQVGIDAQWAAGKVYDYWKFNQNRFSYDNLNGELDNYVHYSTNYDNAFWDGAEMIYGDGSGISNGGFSPLASLDVCAHEIGHGVCQETSNLVYSRESGAMNEGFSDIWGAVIENYGNPFETDAVAKNNWDIGEEIGATPLRSMLAPKLHGQPDTYTGTNWVNATTSCIPGGNNDQCGVHTNSGVLNHWFYLLTMGGIGTNDLNHPFQALGIGMSKAAKIAYNTELVLASTANYADCRLASINAATTLYGACSIELEAVVRAWYAVGVGTNFTPCTPQISFAGASTTVTEASGSAACPSSHNINIPITLSGPALAGGSPTVTVSVTGGTLVSGVDYILATAVVNFTVGGQTTQNAVLTIFDNGGVDTNRYVDLAFTLATNGSNALSANVLTTQRIIVASDDRAPDAGGTEQHNVNTANVTSNLTSPFYSSSPGARTQFILTMPELVASGLRPNTPISAISFNVTQKFSTQPFSGYTVKMGPTALNEYQTGTGFITGLTTVYNGSYTTATGWNTINFATNTTWDGVSNIVVEVCFSNTTSGSSNDRVDGYSTGNFVTAYNSGATGCALPFNASRRSTAKPVVRFNQLVPPAPVAFTQSSTRSWDISSGQQVYFYDAVDSKLIAAVQSPSANLGCTIATITVAGSGFSLAIFGNVNRSVKEFTIAPTQSSTNVTNDATIYFLNSELSGTSLANIRLVMTSAATDAAISQTNTVLVTPQLFNGLDYTGFKGSFTGFGRYFIIDAPISLGVGNIGTSGDFIRVINNPFNSNISLTWQMSKSAEASVALYDVTGKCVYSGSLNITQGKHSGTVGGDLGLLAPGHYFLRVVTAANTFTQQLIKE